MKKNKGFTLVELLAIIIVLGILLILTSYSITSVIRETRTNIKEQEMISLRDAAKMYFNDVIDGNADFTTATGEKITGYGFLSSYAKNCNGSIGTTFCKKNPENPNEFILTIKATILGNYIDLSKYDASRCSFEVIFNTKQNEYGYYELVSLDVKDFGSTKADTCVR